MREQKSTRCPHCRAKAVRGRPGAGRTTVYKTLPCLPLPSELLIPTCSRCRTLFLPTNQKTGALLHLLYVAELRQRTQLAISTLRDVRSLRKLERLLGVSQGYLSKLRAGTSTPSPELTLLLGLLASNPKPLLRRADAFWALPADGCLNLAMRSAL
jgi:hypothetical protein